MPPISTTKLLDFILPERNERSNPNAKDEAEETCETWGEGDLDRRVRTRKGFRAMTPAKRDKAGPSAMSAYPSPAATVISPLTTRPLLVAGGGRGGQACIAAGREMLSFDNG
jgi:hypothetical protein